MPHRTRTGRIAAAAAAAVATLALAAPGAQAGLLVSSVSDCDEQVLEQPFRPWLDPASYTLVPDGTLEGGAAGWRLNGASVVSSNEPFYVHGAGESKSLRIPAGRAATTPAVCVGIEHPTMRFFAKSESSSLLGTATSLLKVEVLFEDAGGNVQALPIGAAALTPKWQPTLPLPVVANLLPLLPGERTAVAFRFTAVGSAAWRIDDVYVDPIRRR